MEKVYFGLKAAGCTALAIIVCCVLMILAYLLPVDKIRENVAGTSQMLETEGVYYQWAEGYKNAQADNYSDASLYLNAMYPGSGNAVKDAMNNPRRLYGDDNNEESVVITARNTGKEAEGHDVNYGRYWHGSLILLKPLLQFLNIADLRILGMIIHMALLFAIIVGFVKRSLTRYLPGFFLAVIMLNPVSAVMCFCYSVEYTLVLLGAALLLHFHEFLKKGQNYYFFFLWSGICTVFFNELCFPMVVFGVSMLIYLLLDERKGWQAVKKELELGLCWGAGYILMWMGKWICAWPLTGYNYFAEALGQALRYTSDHATWEVENPGTWDRIYRNLNVYGKWPFILLILSVVGATAVGVLRKGRTDWQENFRRMPPYFLLALFPFGVYIILGNGYSYVHYWFTHRLLAISAFAVTAMLLQCTESRRLSFACKTDL